MKIYILAKPNSNKNEVKKIDQNHFIVSVTEPPLKGKANKAILKLLSKYLGISFSRIVMVHGHTTRNKVVEILER